MRQTLALLLDAYRELNSKKLFWVTLALSALVIGCMGALGINDKGVTFLHWQMDTPLLTTSIVPASLFYKFLFANFGIPVWLTWAATILALISTASIIPDFIAGGAVELTLSKPIGRVRLYLTKFAMGLLFATLQVFAFSLASFLLFGLRAGSWEPRLFLAVPLVVLMFSYLFCVCALLGLLTRSTIAAMLITLLLWGALFSINFTDTLFLSQREVASINVERSQKRFDREHERAVTRWKEKNPDATNSPSETDLQQAWLPLATASGDLTETQDKAKTWRRWAGIVVAAKTILPKTSETVQLLDRALISKEDKALMTGGRRRGREEEDVDVDGPASLRNGDPEVAKRVEAATRARTTTWIIGTSLAFEGVVLAISCWIFARRDF